MRKWQITFIRSAEKELSKLNSHDQTAILKYLQQTILSLSNPKQLGKPLRYNLKSCWRYRVQKFRIICELREQELVILVVKVAKRDVVYED